VVDKGSVDAVARVTALVQELDVELVVVGRPVGLSGRAGPAVEAQQELVTALRAALDVEVVEHDERLTTVVAEQGLRAGGARRRSRDELRDAVAAQVMLQGYLDTYR
jgi:putative Holliday junction resolvase